MRKLAEAIAHDLNNLLSAISGSAELLERQLDIDHPLISEIKQASARASLLSQQMMQLSESAPEGSIVVEEKDGDESGPRSKTLLVVIKQHSVRLLASGFFTARGDEVLEASGPETAWEVGQSHEGSIDAALVDLDLLSCSGPELMARLAESRGVIPAIYLAEPGTPAEINDGGTVMEAPVKASALAATLDRLLEEPAL